MNASVDGLLEPISDYLSCGDDLSFSAEFDRIHEARREEDPTIDYGEWQTTLKQADWPAVVACCRDLLRTRSKDLRLAAWLTEGLVKTSGLAGLAEGMEISAHLLQRFGAHLHPQAEEGDQEQRIGTLNWFAMRMSQLVRQIPLTQSKAGQFGLNDYETARQLQAQLQRNAESVTDLENKATLEKISSAAGKTDKDLYCQWILDGKRCLSALDQMIKISDQQFGANGPSFSQLNEGIEAVCQRLQLTAKDLGIFTAVEATSAAEVQPADVKQAEQVEPASSIHEPFRSRAQALESLRQVAIFFRNTEPHSPVAYLADKAAHWGAMPLHLWLRSVMKDHGTLSHIEELLGLDLEKESGHSG